MALATSLSLGWIGSESVNQAAKKHANAGNERIQTLALQLRMF